MIKRQHLLLIAIFLSYSLTALFSQSNTTNAVQLYQEGRKEQITGNYFTALEHYRSALEINPKYLEPLIGLSESYIALGEYQEALVHVKRALALNANNQELWLLEGRINIGLANYARAEELFRAVQNKTPNSFQARLGFAEIALAQGKIEVAKIRYSDALRISPENKKALLSYTLLLLSDKDFKKAEEYVNFTLALYPTSPEVRYVAASYFFAVNNLEESENHLSFALSMNPDYSEAKRLYVKLLLSQGKVQEVSSVLEDLLKRDRRDSSLWYSLGIARLKSEDLDGAVSAFKNALAVKPEDEFSRFALEYSVMENTDLRSSQRSILAQYHFDKGVGFRERNLEEKAFLEYRRGLMVDPYSKVGRLGYADLFKKQGYMGKYLEELQVMKDQGISDRDIEDEIEIYTSLLQDSLSKKWFLDQYTLEKSAYSFTLFTEPGSGDLDYFNADYFLRQAFRDYLINFSNINPKIQHQSIASYAEAYRIARNYGSNYFILLSFKESDRFFTLNYRIYITSTGSLLGEYLVQRTGNNKVQEALWRGAKQIHSLLPLYGRIIQRNFDSAIIDLGKWDGLKEKDTLVIIKNRYLEQRKDGFGYEYEQKDLLGELTITRIDEVVSEGSIKSASFFDLVNPGDYVMFKLPQEEEPPVQEEPPKGLLRQIFRF